MLLEVTRMVAAAMSNGTYGVNVKLAALTLDADDDHTPPDVTVLNACDSDVVARGDAVPDWPVLVVAVDDPAESDGEVAQVNRDAAHVPVWVRYVSHDADSAEDTRNALYTLRAMVRSARTWLANANEADRVRNNVGVIRCNTITWGETNVGLKVGRIRAAMKLDLAVRDSAP